MTKEAKGGWASRGRAEERVLIAAYLRGKDMPTLAAEIEQGFHLPSKQAAMGLPLQPGERPKFEVYPPFVPEAKSGDD